MNSAYQDFLDKTFLPPVMVKEFTAERYLNDLKAGYFRDQFVLGVQEKEGGKWLRQDFVESPNAIYVGAMGSGKSRATVFSILTWMLANSEKTQLFIVDPLKNAGDYGAFFAKDPKNGKRKFEQVYEILNSNEGILRLIDLVYDEYLERQKIFKKINSESIKDYEKRSGEVINRVVVVFEEIHAVFQAIDFGTNFKKPLTAANKFWQLMKVGRAAGIWFFGATQRGFSSDIPTEIINNFVNKLIFQVAANESNYFIGNKGASEITAEQKGRCLTQYGFVQFPYIENKDIEDLLALYVKPLKGRFAYLTPKIVDSYLQGTTIEEIYDNKKLNELVQSIESHEAELVVSILHKRTGHQVEKIDSSSNMQGISHIISINKDVKVAVITRASATKKKVSKKHLINLKKAMTIHECVRGIIYTSMTDLSASLYKFATEMNIEIVDHEDMLRMAFRIEQGEHIEVDKLADDDKESGKYQEENNIKEESDEEFSEDDYTTFDSSLGKEDPADVSIMDEVDKKAKEKIENKTPAPQQGGDLNFNKLFKKPEPQNKPKEENPPTPPVQAQDEDDQLDGDITDSVQEESSVPEIPEVDEEPVVETPVPIEVKPPTIEEPAPPPVPKVEEKTIKEKTKEKVQEVRRDIENMIIPKNNVAREVKRLPTKKVFTLQKDSSPSMIFHCLRNESGEVYRLLMVVLENGEIKHQYFLDKKVKSQFSHREKVMLGIETLEEWNSQKEVLDEVEFKKEMMDFLENFQPCPVPVHSICWKFDLEFVRQYLKACKYTIDNPLVIEDFLLNSFGLDYTRKDIIEHLSIKVPKNVTIYTPVEIDFNIWTNLN